MIEEGRKVSVYTTMSRILTHLNSGQEQRSLAGNLAAIRNSSGKGYEDATEVWPILFPLMPQEYLGNGPLNYEEKALISVLQLYALGQQGSSKVLNDDSRSMGSSLRKIRDNQSVSLDRRFNTMLTAISFDEFTYHLRQLYKLGKSRHSFSVNYPVLAEDLYWYQNGKNKKICLKWARDYYQPFQKNENEQPISTIAE